MSAHLICGEHGCMSEGTIKAAEGAGVPAPKVIVWIKHEDVLVDKIRVETLGAHIPTKCPEHRRKS